MHAAYLCFDRTCRIGKQRAVLQTTSVVLSILQKQYVSCPCVIGHCVCHSLMAYLAWAIRMVHLNPVCQYNILTIIEGIIRASKLGTHTKSNDAEICCHIENFMLEMKPNFNEIVDI